MGVNTVLLVESKKAHNMVRELKGYIANDNDAFEMVCHAACTDRVCLEILTSWRHRPGNFHYLSTLIMFILSQDHKATIYYLSDYDDEQSCTAEKRIVDRGAVNPLLLKPLMQESLVENNHTLNNEWRGTDDV
jgi:hypothetical protein